MAPLTLDQITESLSNQESVLSMQDCFSKANATAVGTFLAGFSGGVAVQAQYHRSLPRRMKAFLVIPFVFGLSVSLPIHRYMVSSCMAKWKAAECEATQTQASCSYAEEQSKVTLP